jgi:hypothetical protein
MSAARLLFGKNYDLFWLKSAFAISSSFWASSSRSSVCNITAWQQQNRTQNYKLERSDGNSGVGRNSGREHPAN